MIFFTDLEHLPTFDARGEYLGRLVDMAVDPGKSLRVASYFVRKPSKEVLCITHEQMQSVSVRAAQTTVPAEAIRCYPADEGLLRIKKDVLDQQIIDVNGRKVERVNDVDMDIVPTDGHTDLRILGVSTGLAGAVRRLLQGVTSKHSVHLLTGLLRPDTIPWEFVNLIEADAHRRVKLRISYARLAQLHPADIADILEELSRDEQKAVIESLDDETAARAISEIPTRMQAALLESIPAAKAADIVEEMAPDEAADVLHEMPPETSAGVLASMEKDEAKEVQGLLGFEEGTAGSMMTTEYVVVGDTGTVESALAALRHFEGRIEAVHNVYLIGPDVTLTGVVPIAKVTVAENDRALKELSNESLLCVRGQADKAEVIDLFLKYNLLVLPVVDDHQRLIGVVTADDVLEVVLSKS